MAGQDFNRIAERYSSSSIIQSSASEILFSLLDIKTGESILDIGCGTGNLTKKLFDLSHNKVIGIDPSDGMIDESIKNFSNVISFQKCSAENMAFENEFDVVFCNSAFQWITDSGKAVENIYRALKPGGRIGIQAPAKNEYCPNFIGALEAVKNHPGLGKIFSGFKSPWMFLETAADYSKLFSDQNFKVPFSEIQTIETLYNPDDVFKIFASGAIAGYLNGDYYNCEITDEYISEFQNIIREDFFRQADVNGNVKLVFNRIFLVAVKSD